MQTSHSWRITAPLNSELEPKTQSIEVASSLQIPSFHIVGLPSPEVAEARERVRSSIESSGFDFPRRRVVLNLSPANVRKRGTGVDLAIALGILADSELRGTESFRICAWGELGLDGALKAVGQVTRAVYSAWASESQFLFLPEVEIEEARASLALISETGRLGVVTPPRLVGLTDLHGAWKALLGISRDSAAVPGLVRDQSAHPRIEAAADCGHLMVLPPSLERVIGVAASGRHHLFLVGSRGTGKTHALDWLIALFPQAPAETRLNQCLISELSFSPAYTVRKIGPSARPAALIGTSSTTSLKPGEFSKAHGGLLIADEFPEWHRDSREALREPLESGTVTLTLSRGSMSFPADFTLAANGNFCPCGGWPAEIPPPAETTRIPKCRCRNSIKENYRARLSGPVLDRIDLMARVHRPVLASSPLNRKKAKQQRFDGLRAQVAEAEKLAVASWGKPAGKLTGSELEQILAEHPEWEELEMLRDSQSLRSRHKILRVALSLACWDGMRLPSTAHFIEAGFYRPGELNS